MSCTSPNKVFYTGVNRETGKKKILFTSRNTDFIYRRDFDEKWQLASGISSDRACAEGYEVITASDLVPCGQCLGCRIDYSRQWAARCMLEAKNYDPYELWFVTCTYDDSHLPEAREATNLETGEISPSKFRSLKLKDHQDFVKRLREHMKDDLGIVKSLRYFMSGEYGDISHRPHYHYIFFGLQIPDLESCGNNWRGDIYYKSEWLSKIWENGRVLIGNLDFDSAAYTARYALKKQKGKTKEVYDSLGIDPEFCCMSRRPGIGREYFEENYESIYEYDEIVLPGYDGAFEVQPPRYYDTLLEKLSKADYDRIKETRKDRAEDSELFRQIHRPLIDDDDLFSAKERSYKQKASVLKKGVVK